MKKNYLIIKKIENSTQLEMKTIFKLLTIVRKKKVFACNSFLREFTSICSSSRETAIFSLIFKIAEKTNCRFNQYRCLPYFILGQAFTSKRLINLPFDNKMAFLGACVNKTNEYLSEIAFNGKTQVSLENEVWGNFHRLCWSSSLPGSNPAVVTYLKSGYRTIRLCLRIRLLTEQIDTILNLLLQEDKSIYKAEYLINFAKKQKNSERIFRVVKVLLFAKKRVKKEVKKLVQLRKLAKAVLYDYIYFDPAIFELDQNNNWAKKKIFWKIAKYL